MRFFSRFAVWILPLMVMVTPSTALAEPGGTMIVLDASGSMWGQLDGVHKIVTARQVAGEVLADYPEEGLIGLMAYGHRRKGDCSDIELLVPPQHGAAGEMFERINSINPKGKTPLTQAVSRAVDEVSSRADAVTVVLVTDGLETCEADPCALAEVLAQSGVYLKVHVVGFGLSADEGAQVACLAEKTGGRYFNAQDSEGLREALGNTVLPPVMAEEDSTRPAPEAAMSGISVTASLKPGGPVLKDPRLNWAARNQATGKTARAMGAAPLLEVPEGAYDLSLRFGSWNMARPVAVSEGETNVQHFDLNAGVLTVLVTEGAMAKPSDVRVRTAHEDGRSFSAASGTTFYFPAGPVTVSAQKGSAVKLAQSFELSAGETRVVELNFSFGTVAPVAVWVPGGAPVDARVMVKFANAETGVHVGQSVSGREVVVPAGAYRATAKLGEADVEVDFVLAADEIARPELVLNAAPVQFDVSAVAGRRRMAVLDAAGNVLFSRGRPNEEAVLQAGDYVLEVSRKDLEPLHLAFTVVAGVPLTVTVP